MIDDAQMIDPPDFEDALERHMRDEQLVECVVGSKALTKACFDDPFDYALRLRTGEVIAFSGAEIISAGWVRITVKPMDEQPTDNRVAYPAERGMDIRISDIVWVMDAPNGS